MSTIQWFGIGVLILLAAILVLFVRRALVVRVRGTIKLSFRVSTMVDGRGWSSGFGRFAGDELRWYRMFSFALRPKRVLSRHGLAVESRRSPRGQERLALPHDWVILRCTSHHAPVEIAMAESTVTGFSSWLEASLPGGSSRSLAA
ncbi:MULTISPECIES: DUF2550 domain-containing protein [Micromonosporaceae]|uniref:DUF2550 domain-containing protein n=1 Tax=Micromonosporaceae TaxID=28056 RepID=UPI002417BEF4|nr:MULTISPECIES: DUF2550 domain-containing protein [unclassified Solwaraspora]MDG4772797.1 DUF2550 domain-containing protein [Solwaraspora sp. WMMD792]WBB95787.1 DUF2550 domain-containing protein [Solwaraspora sp. WMMA2059]WBC20309.1 DUF2550 domain-containing protein [Solwaraspora sp. WMMA2080]WFE21755.1 DUF2550 domain-containing protein [Solwaraspora sp. WMMD937]WJK37540.1 DUF2550 domain-containing protein [Solwaraspora sp. WMMA2065]